MAYVVLARKYRPRTFADVAGQDVPMRVLAGALQEGRVGHAYLFCGPRGTGKTTTARILAKALNCERGVGPQPCGTCERCTAIDSGADVDVIEIDAASNRGVDDVRELRERVAYAPLRARFKVYIVDEVHMLTKEANNALLKTLEEPPPHVKFLFATTEPQRLLETVRSRCQIVQLGLIREDVIAARLAHVLEREGVRAAPGVVEELARRARGSLRDALSLTDQLLALAGSEPSLADVERLAGSGGAPFVDQLLERVEQGDRRGLLEALGGQRGGELELMGELLDHVRGCLLAALCPRESTLLESEPTERERRAARAARLGAPRLELWLNELLAARARMAELESQSRLVLELCLLDLARPELTLPIEELAERLMALERRLGAAPRDTSARTSAEPSATPAPASAPRASERTAPAAAPERAAPVERTAPAPKREAPAAAPRAEAAARAPQPGDAFTAAVADLFTGRVEEA
jgi:DNA polymerase-3 subunit gamma/tau